jgi:hypothetical protein
MGGSDSAILAAVALRGLAEPPPNPPDHVTNRFERGAVVRCDDRTWIVWAYPPGRFADPIALPLVARNGPLHRSHVRLDFADRPVVVRCLDPATLPRDRCARIGQCTPEIIATIAVSMRRAIEASQIEARDVRVEAG